MYLTFAATPYLSNGARNSLWRFGDLLQIDCIYGGRLGYDFEIWELEFETCTPELVGALLQSLNDYGSGEACISELLETDCDELWAVVNAPIPERPSLTWCVRRFLAYYPGQWRDNLSARGKCGVVSIDFLHFLRRHNAVSDDQIASGYARVVRQYISDLRYATPDFLAECHEVVAIGRIRIDFTRRQYDPEAPVPTVWISRSDEDNVFPPRKAA